MLFRGFIVAVALAHASGGCGGCSSNGFHLDAPGPDATSLGTVSLTWSVTDLGGQPITCDQVGANTVSVQLHNRESLSGVAASFTCSNSPSTSQPVLAGVYDVSIELHGVAVTLATARDQNGIVVRGGQNTPLEPVAFVVDAKGGLVLTIAVPPAASNCKSPPMGAGITSMTITLFETGGSCAPVTFQRSRGGTYQVNCSSPLNAGCIETDETFTVASMPSGSYTIHILATRVGSECWRNDDTFEVPPKGKSLVAMLNLAHLDRCPP